jgi:hypothetical protein
MKTTTATPDDSERPAVPCDFRDGLKFIAGESVSERLLKVRRFVEWQLRARRRHLPPDQFAHALKAAFLARQRKPFADETEWQTFKTDWLRWWTEIEIPRIRRTNANFLKKPLAPDNESRGNDSDE